MILFLGPVLGQALPSCGSEACDEVPEPQNTVLLQHKSILDLAATTTPCDDPTTTTTTPCDDPTTTTTTPCDDPTTTTTTPCDDPTTTTTTGDSCEIFGDPHVSGFDNSGHEIPGYLGLLSFGAYQRAAHPIDVNVYDVGDFWLVRSADLQIQSRFANSKDFVPDRPAVGAIAISGPLLDNKLLSIQPLDMAVNWDGQQLSEAPLDANVTSGSLNIRSHDGPDGTRVLEVQLPMGVNFRAVRFLHHIDAKVTLPRSFIGQVDGLCGNRNGLAEDDAEETVANRMHSIAVSPDERLLPF